MTGLVFEDVTVRFGHSTAVDGVSLTVPPGQVVGLVGESGSGKSTLARAAVGLVPMQAGRILLDGAPVPTKGRDRPLQMVFQDPYSSLDPRMTIGESGAEALSREVPRRERRGEVHRLLELVHIDPTRAAARPAALSGGQAARLPTRGRDRPELVDGAVGLGVLGAQDVDDPAAVGRERRLRGDGDVGESVDGHAGGHRLDLFPCVAPGTAASSSRV